MNSDQYQAKGRILTGSESDGEDMPIPAMSRRLHWLRPMAPGLFLAGIVVLAVRELQGLHIREVHAVLQTLTQLLSIQLLSRQVCGS